MGGLLGSVGDVGLDLRCACRRYSMAGRRGVVWSLEYDPHPAVPVRRVEDDISGGDGDVTPPASELRKSIDTAPYSSTSSSQRAALCRIVVGQVRR